MSEDLQDPDFTEDEKQLMQELMSVSNDDLSEFGEARRDFLKMMTLAGGGMLALQVFGSEALAAQGLSETALPEADIANLENSVNLAFKVNGTKKTLTVDSRMTLLDTLRERLRLTGSKKGCDHGQCGACTVMVDGRRVLSCLTLAASCEGKSVTTIEGLMKGGTLHPVQAAFIKHDGFQCGYCTPGQICSAVALLSEAKRGEVSYVTQDVRAPRTSVNLSDEEIRERMSGNICRCGAYPNIVAAIREVQSGKEVAQAWEFRDQEISPAILSGNHLQNGSAHETI